MGLIKPEHFFVFDLDDTLFKEHQYCLSGMEAVADYVRLIYKKDMYNNLVDWMKCNEGDIFGRLCIELSIPATVKKSLIWIYRLHKPNISLTKQTDEMITFIEKHSAGIAILTDGRSITQRLKIHSLGIERFPLYISEEFMSEKPEEHRFKKIMQDFPAEKYIYIGDNPAKDFKAPNELGWLTIGLVGDNDNIHSQLEKKYSAPFLPELY